MNIENDPRQSRRESLLRKLTQAGADVAQVGYCWHIIKGQQHLVVADLLVLDKNDFAALGMRPRSTLGRWSGE